MAKITKSQRQERARIVMEMLLSDTPRCKILSHVDSVWGVGVRSADRYIREAADMIRQEGDKLREQSFAYHLAKLKWQRHNALENNDDRLAFDILKDLGKLLNLYPAKEKRVTNLDVDMSELSTEQLQQIARGDDPATVLAAERKTV